jgi:hypothetical protein
MFACIFKTSESVAYGWFVLSTGCVPLVSFVGRRFSVSPIQDQKMLGGWGCRKRELTFYRGSASKTKAAPFLIARPLFAEPFKMLMSSFFIFGFGLLINDAFNRTRRQKNMDCLRF